MYLLYENIFFAVFVYFAYGHWKKFLSVLNYHAVLVNHSKVSWMNIDFPVYRNPLPYIYIKNNEIDPHNAHKSIRAHFIVISSHFLSSSFYWTYFCVFVWREWCRFITILLIERENETSVEINFCELWGDFISWLNSL